MAFAFVKRSFARLLNEVTLHRNKNQCDGAHPLEFMTWEAIVKLDREHRCAACQQHFRHCKLNA